MPKEDVQSHRPGTMAFGQAGSALLEGQKVISEMLQFDNSRTGSMSNVAESDTTLNSQLYTDQYIAFLKQISLNLSTDCILFFFNPKDDVLRTFPLYQMAIKFYNHQDNLIKTSI